MSDTSRLKEKDNETILQQLPFLPEEKLLISSAEKRIVNYILSVSKMTSADIDRDLAEETNDMNFIIEQVKAEPKRYSSDQCRKISHDLLLKQVRIAILKSELDRRSMTSKE